MTIHDDASAARPLTTELFREVRDAGRADDLVAVGLALHHFTELVDEIVGLDALELHRATTILTKQLTEALDAERPLRAVADLVTDPERTATVDRRTAEQLCGRAWPAVRDVAADRATSAIDGADTFGEATVLHLAATRAVRPTCAWWGTDGWERRVEAWADAYDPGGRVRPALATTPEYVDDAVLRDLIGAPRPAPEPARPS